MTAPAASRHSVAVSRMLYSTGLGARRTPAAATSERDRRTAAGIPTPFDGRPPSPTPAADTNRSSDELPVFGASFCRSIDKLMCGSSQLRDGIDRRRLAWLTA